MKTTSLLSLILTAGVILLSCSTNTDPSDEMPPPPEEEGVLQPEWSVMQRSPVANGNAEAWGLDIYNNKIYWAVSQVMPGTQMDVFLHQLNTDSTRNWVEMVVAEPFTDQAYFLTLTDSLAYIGGRTCGTLAGLDKCDALIATTDANTGAFQWKTSWTRFENGYEEVDGIVPQPSGLLVSGWSQGETTSMDLFLQKYDHAQNLLWTQTLSSPGERYDHQDGHIIVDDSMVYMAGLYDGSVGFGYNGRSLLLKAEKNTGSLVDSVTFGRSDPWVNAENALGMASDGESLFITGFTTPSNNNWEIFVTKYDKDLNRIWYTTWGGSGTESARSLVVDDNGTIYVAATTQSYGNGGSDVALIKFDPSGNEEWYRTWGGTGNDSAFDIRYHQGSVYITGRTNSFHPNNRNEAFLIREDVD